MSKIKLIFSTFFILTIIVLLPIYFFTNQLFITAFFSVLFYTILWSTLELTEKKISKVSKNNVMTIFGLFIGVKFLMTFVFMIFLIKTNLLNTVSEAAVVMFFYFIYTIIMLKSKLVITQ